MRSLRLRRKGSIVVAEQSGLPGVRVVSPRISESHGVQEAHVRRFDDHVTLVNPEKTARPAVLVRQPERTVRTPMPSIQLPPIVENKKWKHVKLQDLLTEEQGNVLLYLMNAQDWDEIWTFLEGLKDQLEAKGVVPGYLYYALQAQFKEDVSHEEVMDRIEGSQDWTVGMKFKTVELNMISRIDDLKKLLIESPSQKDFLEKQLRLCEHELITLRKYKEAYLSLDDAKKQQMEIWNKQPPVGFTVVENKDAKEAFNKIAKLQKNIKELNNEIEKGIAELPEDVQPIMKAMNKDIASKRAQAVLKEFKEQSTETSWHALPTGRPRRKK